MRVCLSLSFMFWKVMYMSQHECAKSPHLNDCCLFLLKTPSFSACIKFPVFCFTAALTFKCLGDQWPVYCRVIREKEPLSGHAVVSALLRRAGTSMPKSCNRRVQPLAGWLANVCNYVIYKHTH